jgi:hypothetical protein
MFRIIRWPLLALALIVIGLWPAAAAPIALAGAGLTAVIAWLKHQPTPARTV